MIAIVNVSGGDPDGVCDYEVRINHDVITTFKHRRSDGLAKCLLLASQAVDQMHANNLRNMLEYIAEEAQKKK